MLEETAFRTSLRLDSQNPFLEHIDDNPSAPLF